MSTCGTTWEVLKYFCQNSNFSCEASAELGMLFYSHDVHEQMFTAAICGHRREPVGLCTYRLHSHIVSQHVACTHWILCSTKCCWFWYYQQWIIVSNWIIYCWKLLLPFTLCHKNISYWVSSQAPPKWTCVCLQASSVFVCVCQWLMNVAGWRQLAMTARLQGNHFFTLRGLLIQNLQEFCWLLKSQHESCCNNNPNNCVTAEGMGSRHQKENRSGHKRY